MRTRVCRLFTLKFFFFIFPNDVGWWTFFFSYVMYLSLSDKVIGLFTYRCDAKSIYFFGAFSAKDLSRVNFSVAYYELQLVGSCDFSQSKQSVPYNTRNVHRNSFFRFPSTYRLFSNNVNKTYEYLKKIYVYISMLAGRDLLCTLTNGGLTRVTYTIYDVLFTFLKQ